MSDDYLWDKSGEPDPEIAKLERTLGALGHKGDPLVLPETIGAVEPTGRRRPVTPFDLRWLGVPVRAWAAAAALVVVVGAALLWMSEQRANGWQVARVDGVPRVGAGEVHGTGPLAVGEWLETDGGARARVKVGKIGELLVEPNTRLRLLGAGAKEHRLQLALGTVTAVILAPPRQFVVETPSAAAVDLGCAYTLQVDAVGGAMVTVLVGWVSFEREGRESFIPAGARCATRPGFGPGTPYFTDATAAFKNALTALDLAGDDAAREPALTTVLAEARREDALTLWHLLARMQGAQRGEVYDRLAALVPPPTSVTREGVLSGDHAMLDRWWERLGLGEARYWRQWQRGWPRT